MLLLFSTTVKTVSAAFESNKDNAGSGTEIRDIISPGIGFEFQTKDMKFFNGSCDLGNTRNSVQDTIQEHEGKNWKLAAGTCDGQKGALAMEYVTDGLKCKLGTYAARDAVDELSSDIREWYTSRSTQSEIPVQLLRKEKGEESVPNPCNPWIAKPAKPFDQVKWSPQVTVALPLEAIWRVLLQSKYLRAGFDPPDQSPWPNVSIADPRHVQGQEIVHVTKDFFRAKPNGMGVETPDEVKGFLSLILSYVKSAHPLGPGKQLKRLLWITPKTDFVGIYQSLRADSKIQGSLFDLVSILVCYDLRLRRSLCTGAVEVTPRIDTNFCSGTLSKPKLTANLGQLGDLEHSPRRKFSASRAESPTKYMTATVKEWIDSIQRPPKSGPDDGLDKLSAMDRTLDGSIGTLGKKMEPMYGDSTGRVNFPIMEFRKQPKLNTKELNGYAHDVEQNMTTYHELYRKYYGDILPTKRSGSPGS
ncbi:MAG: hypothetical protein Q9227_002327 [Pyrenula ochraceoflavens]